MLIVYRAKFAPKTGTHIIISCCGFLRLYINTPYITFFYMCAVDLVTVSVWTTL
jgi:hypothetical protein